MKINDKLANGLYLGQSMLPGAGVGLFTGYPIKGGVPVCEYKGEVFQFDSDRKFSKSHPLWARYEYTMQSGFKAPALLYSMGHNLLGKEIDAHPAFCKEEMGLGAFANDARNHTNREVKDDDVTLKFLIDAGYNVRFWEVPNEPMFYLLSLREIQAGEEILVNYGDNYWATWAGAEAEITKAQNENKKKEEEPIKAEPKNEKKEEKENELASA